MLDRLERSDDIAIIGMAGRVPGAQDVDELWTNLAGGVESITFFDDDELLAAGVEPEELADPNYVRASPVLEGMEDFDAGFFGFTPKEADIRDPQQRVFLECCHTALERAGHDPARYDGDIGVFAGVFTNRYAWLNVRKNPPVYSAVGPLAVEISNHADYLCTLVSYKLNLRGPSLTVATACSTSLVAIHLACQALRNGECDMALAGGVEIELPAGWGYMFAEGGIFSRDGHCRAFDAGATGTVFGSGAGVVLLRRLDEALAGGDHVVAVIRGSAVNNDGSHKVGFTAPSVEGQLEVVSQAYGAAQIDPRSVSFVEAHGTATQVGDPIEVAALSQVFQSETEDRGWCAIGSVKTNVGHLGPAAGVVGLIKTVLALEHRQIPPSLHFEEHNPKIDFGSSPFYVNTALIPWPSGPTPRRAGVSSFGIGGTNAHIIVEEAPTPPATTPGRPWQLLTLSARTPTALDAASQRLADHLQGHPDMDLADVAHTCQIGRGTLRQRRIAVCADAADAADVLAGGDARRVLSGAAESRPRPVCFMFPGQGAQHVNMGRELYEAEPTFRETVDQCCHVLRPHLGLDLREVLYPQAGEEAAAELLTQTRITQPALFVVEYALARLWMRWGVSPRGMIGHSIGEYVAAALAGVFSRDQALGLVAARGRLMQQLPGGSMLVLPLDEETTAAMIGPDLSIASVNGPSQCVVSGPTGLVDELAAELAQQGIVCPRLRTSHAFHSAAMEPILAEFADLVREAAPRPPEVPFVSNLTGTWILPEEATSADYWARHLRRTVRFSDGLSELGREEKLVLLEVGPGQSLTGLARQHPAAGQRTLSAACGFWASPWTGPSCTPGSAGGESCCRPIRTSGAGTGWTRCRPAPRRPRPGRRRGSGTRWRTGSASRSGGSSPRC